MLCIVNKVIPAKLVPGLNREPARSAIQALLPGVIEQLQTLPRKKDQSSHMRRNRPPRQTSYFTSGPYCPTTVINRPGPSSTTRLGGVCQPGTGLNWIVWRPGGKCS
jgi:hypothetical protein